MINLIPFLKIFPVLLFALMSPGPSFVMVSNLSLTRGRYTGLACAAGMGTSDFIFASLSLLGLGLILQEAPNIMIVMTILGGLYLLYIGVIILRSSFKPSSGVGTAPKIEKKKNAFLLGLTTSLHNPKVIIFYGSILTAVMGLQSSTATKIFMAPFCGIVAFAWYGFVAIALSVPKIRTRYQKWGKPIDRVCGLILCAFSVALIASVIF